MKRILVTGSEGYIGCHLVPLLQRAGFDVCGLDACWFDGPALIQRHRSCPVLRKDVRDVERPDLRGIWAVVHLAALSNDPVGELEAEVTLDVNYRATVRLAELSKAAGVERFVFSSSCSMYGVSQQTAVDETADFHPQTAYARSKVMAERELTQIADDRFSPIYLRNATAYGISPRQRFDLVLPNLAAWAYTTGEVKILSDGTPWRPLVHIDDISKAVVCSLTAPREAIHNQAFNVGDDNQNYQVREIAEVVQQAFPGCGLSFGPPPEKPDTRSYRVDFSKIRHGLPGFRTQWTIQRGARECAVVFRQIQLDEATFLAPGFTRLKQLRNLMETGQLNGQLRWTRRQPRAA